MGVGYSPLYIYYTLLITLYTLHYTLTILDVQSPYYQYTYKDEREDFA